MHVYTFLQGEINLPVSVKVANERIQDRRHLLKEAAFMGHFCHGNIVRLCGVVTDSSPVSTLRNNCSTFAEAFVFTSLKMRLYF